MPAVNFINGTKDAWTSRYMDERSINWVPEVDEDGRYIRALRGAPGLTSFATAGSGPIRGFGVLEGILYAVSDTTLYKVKSDGTTASVGTVMSSRPVVPMAEGSGQLLISGGAQGYVYTTSGGLASIHSPWPYGTTVAYQDTYFITNQANTNRFYLSASLDGTSWDALDFSTADGAAGNLLAVFSNHRELLLFGERTIEVWYDSGNADFPFTRNPSAFIEMGLAAIDSVAAMDNTVYFLGAKADTANHGAAPAVYRLNGYTPERVSFGGLEERIRAFTRYDDAIAYTYDEAGHSFYVLTFPTASETWVYDAATGLWHERQSWGLTRHRGNCHAYVYGKHLVGDYANGTIWEQSLDVYADGSNPLVAERRAKRLHNDGRYLFLPELELFFDTGLGLATGQGSDPVASLSWSDDGGHTWSNDRFATLGKIGEYTARTIWRRLGKSRDRIFRVRVSEPIPRNLVGGRV